MTDVPNRLPLDARVSQMGNISALQTNTTESDEILAMQGGYIAGLLSHLVTVDADADSVLTIEVNGASAGTVTVESGFKKDVGYYLVPATRIQIAAGDRVKAITDGGQILATALELSLVVR